jgi:5,10-methenyltetrahydrofolate synthetase
LNGKPAIRRALLEKRRALDNATRAQWDRRIGEHLARYLRRLPGGVPSALGVYLSTQNEPDLMAFYAELSGQGVALSVPVVTGKALPLQFAQWKPGDPLVKDRYGIATPAVQEWTPVPRVVLVPCLGYTADRFRLGYGGGYFDRTLEQTTRPHAIGVAYACLQAAFPTQPHDIAMDGIITETGVV